MEYLVLCALTDGSIADGVLRSILDLPALSNEDADLDSFNFNEAVEHFERRLLEKTLQNSNSLRDAGEKLNLNTSTISRKIKQYGIPFTIKNSFSTKKRDISASLLLSEFYFQLTDQLIFYCIILVVFSYIGQTDQNNV